ncbi:MAG: helix-turn-helix domain-containing protein [Thermodesulfobacteriota bacterium]|nr:helix-turn-helix domain-containing protein [Thermodesulfobacteriota bacterium]
MKSFENSNYYELLGVRSDVSQFQIRLAYRKAMELYRHKSMVSYSFFSDGQRKQILAMLENAFSTLVDRDSRYRYDLQMVQSGVLKRDELSVESSTLAVARDREKRKESFKSTTTLLSHLGENTISAPVMSELLKSNTITGDDLKQAREASGVSLKEMAEHTKIRAVLLTAIENDDYEKLPSQFHLKGFLKAYVSCLVADDDIVVRIVKRYIERIEA